MFIIALLLSPLLILINDNNIVIGFRQKTHYFIAINPGASDINSQHPFNSSRLTVPAGSNVTWINNDNTSVYHWIVSGDPNKGPSNIFYSNALRAGERFSFGFVTPGIYPFYDKNYPHMTGQITVLENNTR
jgi:plastocyanin